MHLCFGQIATCHRLSRRFKAPKQKWVENMVQTTCSVFGDEVLVFAALVCCHGSHKLSRFVVWAAISKLSRCVRAHHEL